MDLALVERSIQDTIFCRKLHWFAQIDSTNVHAMEQGRRGAPHGSVYLANEQLAGRGRGDHSWHSAAGQGLYVSVLLRPGLLPQELIWLPLMTGLALHRAIEEATGLRADLRWPNDILIHGRKCAGILVEAQSDAGLVTFAVAGIGVNLRQSSFPAEMATPATSLELETGREVSSETLFVALLQSLQAELESMCSQASRAEYFARIPARLESISSWVRGRSVQVHGPQECSGVTAGLNADGFLQVQTAEGMRTVLTGGLREAVLQP